MKNIKKLLTLIVAFVMAISFTACGGGTVEPQPDEGGNKDLTPKGECLLRAGVISDSQIEAGTSEGDSNHHGPEQLKAGLEYYKAHNVDCLFFLGDIVNNAQQTSYDVYNSVMDSVWPVKADRPEIIFNLGNHERYACYGPGTPNNDETFTTEQFRKNTGEELHVHKNIKGYSFITIPSRVYDSADNLDRSSIVYLEKQLAIADQTAKGEKPIFVGIHEPVAGTVCGEGFSTYSATLKSKLKKYPNVILFTGHSHFPISDERSIFQKDFTAVNTGSSSYCCLGEPLDDGTLGNKKLGLTFSNVYTNGSMKPMKNKYSGVDAHHQSLGLVVEVYENVTTIERRNFRENSRVGEIWSVPTNTTVDDFIYTNERYEFGERATWNENHVVNVARNGKTIEITWDEANWSKTAPVECYLVEILNKNENIVSSKAIVGDYYAGKGPSNYGMVLNLPDHGAYKLRITPYDCFSMKGDVFEKEIPAV